MNFLLFSHFFLNLYYEIFFIGLVFFPFLKNSLLQSFLFHFIVIFELDDGKIDVSFLVLKVFGILLIESHDLVFIIFFLFLKFLRKLSYFSFISFCDFVHVAIEFFVFLRNRFILSLHCPNFRFQTLHNVLI